MIARYKYNTATFATAASWSGNGRREVHVAVIPRPFTSLEETVQNGNAALEEALREEKATTPGMEVVFRRWYLSDIENQYGLVPGEGSCTATVGQPPLGARKGVLLAILRDTSGFRAYEESWHIAEGPEGFGCNAASAMLLQQYSAFLREKGMSLPDNCLRTWFLVRDIDVHYPGMVEARNSLFSSLGLSKDTHFISSTGIGAHTPSPRIPLHFEAVAIKGMSKEQVTYLKARTRMNATSDYGVAFERATAVDYGDRRVVYVSGTASIGPDGQIMYPGDVRRQTERMCGNVESLLKEGGCDASDVMHMVVYLRDSSDAKTALEEVGKRFPDVPVIAVQAPVCRPGWLVEMECFAMAEGGNPDFAPY